MSMFLRSIRSSVAKAVVADKSGWLLCMLTTDTAVPYDEPGGGKITRGLSRYTARPESCSFKQPRYFIEDSDSLNCCE